MRKPGTLALLAVAAAAAVVWSATTELEWAERAWTTFLLAVLPALILAQAAVLHGLEAIERETVYASSALSLWVLAAVTFVVAFLSDTPLAALGLRPLPLVTTLLWSAGALLAGLGVMATAHLLGIRESTLLRHLLPRAPREKALFVGLSFTAGFCEELVFRGFLIGVLLVATDSLVLAVLLSSAVFGVLHAYQRPTGALRAAALGALLAAPLIATGSILPSMIAHAALDIVAGLWLRDALVRG